MRRLTTFSMRAKVALCHFGSRTRKDCHFCPPSPPCGACPIAPFIAPMKGSADDRDGKFVGNPRGKYGGTKGTRKPMYDKPKGVWSCGMGKGDWGKGDWISKKGKAREQWDKRWH